MTRDEYAATICARLDEAVRVPFLPNPLGDVAECHANVDAWVASHSDYEAVRGWVTCVSFGELGARLTAHSVVRSPDGRLHDITPLIDEAVRAGMHFVEHHGSDELFFEAKAVSVFIDCVTC
jgi:hypothetical protein